MAIAKTRDAVYTVAGSLVLLGIIMSKYNKRWLALSGLIGIGLLNAGINGFCGMAYIMEKAGITRPENEIYESERLKRLKLVKKWKKTKKKINKYIKGRNKVILGYFS